MRKTEADTGHRLSPDQRFVVVGLSVAQGLLASGQITMATIAAIVGSTLSPAPGLATLPVTSGVVGIALATLPVARLIQNYGRRAVFIGSCAWGAGGALLAAASIQFGSFVGFCTACFLIGNNSAVVAQFRFALADLVPPSFVSRAVSALMIGMLVAALVMPWAIVEFKQISSAEFAGSFAILPLLFVAAALVIFCLPLGSRVQTMREPARVATPGEILRRPEVQLAIAASAIGYAVMSLIMTATPISMHVMDHHSVDATAGVIRGHLLAMFAPSLVTGWLIARIGLSRMLWAGILLEALCVALALGGHGEWNYRFALIALGVGWNLLFVGGTTLLARVCRDGELLRVQGFNDFVMFSTMALASLSAGALLETVGWSWTNIIALTLLSLVVIALWRSRRAL